MNLSAANAPNNTCSSTRQQMVSAVSQCSSQQNNIPAPVLHQLQHEDHMLADAATAA